MPNDRIEYHVRVQGNADSTFSVDIMQQTNGTELLIMRIANAFTEQAARETALRFLAALIVEVNTVDLCFQVAR